MRLCVRAPGLSLACLPTTDLPYDDSCSEIDDMALRVMRGAALALCALYCSCGVALRAHERVRLLESANGLTAGTETWLSAASAATAVSTSRARCVRTPPSPLPA